MYQAVSFGSEDGRPRSILVQRSRSPVEDAGVAADGLGVLRLIHERLAELARGGYRHHPVTAEVRLDERAARTMSCPECNYRGLHFTALAHPARPGHISLAWCDLCRVAMDVHAPRPPASAPRGMRVGSSVA
jgi:hypothetical protein